MAQSLPSALTAAAHVCHAQAEVFNGAILQQAFVVEFVVEDHMCPDCTRRAVNPNQWVACVQVRTSFAVLCTLSGLPQCHCAETSCHAMSPTCRLPAGA